MVESVRPRQSALDARQARAGPSICNPRRLIMLPVGAFMTIPFVPDASLTPRRSRVLPVESTVTCPFTLGWMSGTKQNEPSAPAYAMSPEAKGSSKTRVDAQVLAD